MQFGGSFSFTRGAPKKPGDNDFFFQNIKYNYLWINIVLQGQYNYTLVLVLKGCNSQLSQFFFVLSLWIDELLFLRKKFFGGGFSSSFEDKRLEVCSFKVLWENHNLKTADTQIISQKIGQPFWKGLCSYWVLHSRPQMKKKSEMCIRELLPKFCYFRRFLQNHTFLLKNKY